MRHDRIQQSNFLQKGAGVRDWRQSHELQQRTVEAGAARDVVYCQRHVRQSIDSNALPVTSHPTDGALSVQTPPNTNLAAPQMRLANQLQS